MRMRMAMTMRKKTKKKYPKEIKIEGLMIVLNINHDSLYKNGISRNYKFD